MTVRPAGPAEREALEALQWRASLAWERYRAALLAHPDAIALPLEQIEAGRVWVAEVDGASFGFSVMLPRPDGDAELDGLFVESDRWRTGIGRALAEAAARRAFEAGAAWLHVVANPMALGFYEACGFELIGEVETRFGVAFAMKRSLERKAG